MLRFWVTRTVQTLADTPFPVGTLIVNGAGSFVIGLIAGIAETVAVDPLAKTLIVTGFLGALTTFSTFSLETVNLIRIGQGGTAVLNVLVSVGAGLTAVFAGIAIVRWLSTASM